MELLKSDTLQNKIDFPSIGKNVIFCKKKIPVFFHRSSENKTKTFQAPFWVVRCQNTSWLAPRQMVCAWSTRAEKTEPMRRGQHSWSVSPSRLQHLTSPAKLRHRYSCPLCEGRGAVQGKEMESHVLMKRKEREAGAGATDIDRQQRCLGICCEPLGVWFSCWPGYLSESHPRFVSFSKPPGLMCGQNSVSVCYRLKVYVPFLFKY